MSDNVRIILLLKKIPPNLSYSDVYQRQFARPRDVIDIYSCNEDIHEVLNLAPRVTRICITLLIMHFNYVCYMLSAKQCFPCYMVSEVGHLALFDATSFKTCQNCHHIVISCYRHVDKLYLCIVSSLFA